MVRGTGAARNLVGYRAVKAALSIPTRGRMRIHTVGFRELLVSHAVDIVSQTPARRRAVRMQEDRRHGWSIRRPVQSACLGNRHCDRRIPATPGRCANTYADLACASRADTGVRPDGAPNSSSRSDAAAQHVGGIVRVPEGPGLGIEVSREALSSLAAP